MTALLAERSAPTKPEVAWVPVDPATAARWLQNNVSNRTLAKSRVNALARDMAAGNWRLTGEAIKFAPDGTLLDGQHRLSAIVKSGVAITMLVIRNIPTDAQPVMDTGRARTASDALQIAGTKYASIVAAAARLAIKVERGDMHNLQPTHSEINDWIDANPGIYYASEFASSVYRRTDCPPSIVAYTHYVLSRIDTFDAANFWTAAANKVGLKQGDPVIALTNRFAEARRNRQHLHQRTQIGMIYRAWNARRAGKSLSVVRVNSPAGGLIPIPEPR